MSDPKPRTIEISFDQDRFTELCRHVPVEQAWAAIGRLASWAPDWYPNARVWIADTGSQGQAEIVSLYRDGNGNGRFTIGAVWHDDHFGFHS